MKQTLDPPSLNELIVLHGKGWSKRKLARHFRISRNTVTKVLRAHDNERKEGVSLVPKKRTLVRSSKLDPFVPDIKRLLTQYPDATGVRVFEELKLLGFTGGITIVRERLKTLREKQSTTPVVRFETKPGRQGQMDWSPFTIKLRDGSRLGVLCFSYILAFSRRHFIDFTLNRKFHTLIRRHVAAFHHFGGVPRTCLYDNEKTIVLRWEAGQPIFNPAFLRFITHYECRPVACRPKTPRTKGKVERPFRYVLSSLLNCRTFDDLEDLRACARWWMANKSDLHIHDTTRRPPIELFMEQEKQALLPLPNHDYDCAEIAIVLGREEGFVVFQTNKYSVPPELVGSLLTLRATEDEVELYDPLLKRIALHPRAPDGDHHYNELPEHRASKQVRYGLGSVRDVFLALGDGAEAFLAGLTRKFPRNPGFHARRILGFKQCYHSDDIHKALCHANRYQAFDSASIERILKARFAPRTLEQLLHERSAKALQESMPKVEQRSLSVYRVAFESPKTATPTSKEGRHELDPEPDRSQGHPSSQKPRPGD